MNQKERLGYLFYGIAARIVIRHRCTVKNLKTTNAKRLTIQAAMPNNDQQYRA